MLKTRNIIPMLSAVLASLVFAGAGYSATYHVSPAGNNLVGDGSESSPWATPSYACSKVKTPGDVISLEAGTLNDSVQCVLAPGVSFQGAGKDKTTIVSNLNDWYLVANNNPVTGGNQTLSGFTLDGNNKTLAHGISVIGRNNVTIDNVAFTHIRATALRLYGYEWWDKADQDWPPVPPPGYAQGCVVSNVTMTGCSDVNYQAAFLLQSMQDLLVDNVVIDESVSTGGKGNAIKSWPGWIKHSIVRNSSFTVDQANGGEIISLEMWNFETDTEIYNNSFTGGFVSLVSGRKDGGSLALKMHDNKLVNAKPYGTAHELSVDDVEFFNNRISGESLGIWAATHMYNGDGVSNVNVHHNIITNANNQGITVQNGPGTVPLDSVSIHDNVIDGTNKSWPDAGISVSPNHDTPFTNLSVTNNVFQSLGIGVQFSGLNSKRVASPVVTGNQFYAVGTQVSDEGTSSPQVSGNTTLSQPAVTTAG